MALIKVLIIFVVILALLNGVTSEEALSQTFGPEKVLYAVAQGMDAVREGSRLTYTHGGTLGRLVSEPCDVRDLGTCLRA